MTTHIITDEYSPQKWNELAHHPLQTWEWGEARASLGTTVVRFVGPDIDGIASVFQATIHPIPHTNRYIGYIAKSAIPSPQVLDFIADYARTNNIVYVKFEPVGLHPESTKIPSSLKKSPSSLFPAWTQILDLTPTEDELFAKLKSKTRYNVRLATKKGVIVHEQTDAVGFEAFFSLYEETERRQHHYGHNHTYHAQVFAHMRPYSHILVASYDGKPLAAYHLFLHNDTLYYPYGGSTTQHKDAMAPNLLMWGTIRLGKKLGARQLDMWGSLPPNYEKAHAWQGFTRFKAGYGSEYVQSVGSYDLVISPVLYTPLMIAWKARSAWLERF